MKYFLFCTLCLISFNLEARGRPGYIKVSDITGNYYELEHLEDFLYFMRENKTKKVFIPVNFLLFVHLTHHIH